MRLKDVDIGGSLKNQLKAGGVRAIAKGIQGGISLVQFKTSVIGPFSYFFLPGTVNCYKWTFFAALSAIAASALPI